MPRPILQISVHTDSRSTIEILKQENANKKMNRHIQIRLKSVQRLLGKIMILNFVKSKKNLSDPLTKGLSRSVIRIIMGDGFKPIVKFTDSGNLIYMSGS